MPSCVAHRQTACDFRSAQESGASRRSKNETAGRSPRPWPRRLRHGRQTECDPGASRYVGGLPTSCSSAPQASVIAHPAPAAPAASVCGSTRRPRDDTAAAAPHPSSLRLPAAPRTSRSGFIQQLKRPPRMALRSASLSALRESAPGLRHECARQVLRIAASVCRFNVKSESRRKANRAQHAKLVFFKALLRPTNGANHARIQIVQPANDRSMHWSGDEVSISMLRAVDPAAAR